MEKVSVNVLSDSIPEYKTEGSAGVDISNVDGGYVLQSLERKLFSTGIKLAVPEGYEVQIRPRSGLALKQGVTVLNTPGTIDSDYRGDIGVILVNLSAFPVLIEKGERIAQMVLSKVEKIDFIKVSSLLETDRGEGGFGSTGKFA